MPYEMLKLQCTHYSKGESVSLFKFSSLQSPSVWTALENMADYSQHFKGINVPTCQTFQVGFSISALFPTSAMSSLVLPPNVDVHHHSFLYLII